MLKLFEANLDAEGSGEVMASPDHATGPGGDYYFAWARDGALRPGRHDSVRQLEHWGGGVLLIGEFDSDGSWFGWVFNLPGPFVLPKGHLCRDCGKCVGCSE